MKVLCFAIPRDDGYVDAVATDEAGTFITAQVSSTEGWARSDIQDSSFTGFHAWFYRQRSSDGFEFEWRDHPPAGWDGQREHTDDTVKPWHLDPLNRSSLYQPTETEA